MRPSLRKIPRHAPASGKILHLQSWLNMDVLQALRSMEGQAAFDCIFMDPPYNNELERQVLEYLQDSSLADEDTLIIVEADLHTDFSYVEEFGYELSRSKEYKTNKHIFLHKRK